MAPGKWRLVFILALLGVFFAAFIMTGPETVTLRKALLIPQISTSLGHVGPLLVKAAILLLATLLLGRVYCSFVCPAGLIQELFHRLGGLLRLRRLRFVPAARPVAVLVVVSAFTVAGVIRVADFLDPIGLFGRLAAPAGEIAGRGESSLDPLALLVAGAGAALLILPALFRGRWFCDRLCPIGALLGVFASLGGGRSRILKEKCVSCGQCEKVCQTRCADSVGKTIDPARCVICLDCAGVCRFGAIAFSREGDGARRNFIHAAPAAVAGGLFVLSRELGGALSGNTPRPAHILPPGAASDARHAMRCVSCQACVPACPVGILHPVGASQRPVLDYDSGYCQYGCQECILACSAGALDELSIEEKQRTRIGDTSLRLDRCVVVTKGTSCGACAEVCPTHAVVMVEQGGGKPTLPDFKKEYCIGCGACYHVCPAEPRAFMVAPLARQEQALGVRLEGHAETDSAGEGRPAGEEYEMQDFPF